MKKKIILTYPFLGMSGTVIKHIPLGLLYASASVINLDVEIIIFDSRLFPINWKQELIKLLDDDVLIVGISVMIGKPIIHALEISHLVKTVDPQIKVVWGGAFATFYPEIILENDPYCDFVISGYGSKPFFHLVNSLLNNTLNFNFSGIYYKNNDHIIKNPPDLSCHEMIDYKEIPYHLIKDYNAYGQFDQEEKIFSIYSAMGCIYQCSFCSSPSLYKEMKGNKWATFSTLNVVEHIEFLINRYNASYIYFIDDDSFINLDHVEKIIDEINKRDLKIKLGFRGARINEIKKMSHNFIDKLSKAGTNILHVGAESGSNRILKLINKNCTVDDIIECNKKLAQHPNILVFYNFIIGIPTETLDELKCTTKLMYRLIKDNPQCIIGTPNQLRPLPGTVIYELACKEWRYKPPKNLIEFSEIEVEGEYNLPWFTEEFSRYCQMMLICSYFIDNKIKKLTVGKTFFYRAIKICNFLYRPIAIFRIKNKCSFFLIETYLYKKVSKFMARKQQTFKEQK